MEENFQNEEPEMTLSEKLAYEERVVSEAFNNSYLIITNRKKFEDLLPLPHERTEDKMMAITAHNPEEDPDIDTLDNMIYYYEDFEEYEKCAELLNVKKKLLEDV